jgi:general secretion pathway protein G
LELLVVIVIIATLAALLFPVFNTARRNAKGSVCLSNLRQIGAATALYMSNYDGRYPMIINGFERTDTSFTLLGRSQSDDPLKFPDLTEALLPYSKSQAIFLCPLDVGAQISMDIFEPTLAPYNGGASYLVAELFNGQTESAWKDVSKATWACDGSPRWHAPAFDPDRINTNRVNAVFYDWHAALKPGNSPTFLQ